MHAPVSSGRGSRGEWSIALIAIVAIIALALLLNGLLNVASALADELTVSVSIVPDTELTVGDPVEIRVVVAHEPGDRVLFESSLAQLGGMEPSAPVIGVINERETRIVFQTRAFAVGMFLLDLPSIPIQHADGSLTELALRPVSIVVASVLTEGTEPRPINAPDLLPGDNRAFTPWIVAIIGVGLGFVLARLLRRRYRRPASVATGESSEAAVAERASFDTDASLGAADQCRQLASAVRSRLGDDWSLPASALTSSEIGPALASAGAPGVIALRATRLLEACDRVQYGGEQPTPERLQGYLQLAEAIWSEGDVS